MWSFLNSAFLLPHLRLFPHPPFIEQGGEVLIWTVIRVCTLAWVGEVEYNKERSAATEPLIKRLDPGVILMQPMKARHGTLGGLCIFYVQQLHEAIRPGWCLDPNPWLERDQAGGN